MIGECRVVHDDIETRHLIISVNSPNRLKVMGLISLVVI